VRVYATCEVAGEAHFTHKKHAIQVGLPKPEELKIYQYVEFCLATRTDFNVCWPWPSAWANAGGYGMMSHAGIKGVYAHRLAYTLYTGRTADLVMHTCDNPACFNPTHLFGGTHQDNATDMVKKGRSSKGRKMPGTRCSDDEVREIRRLWVEGMSRIELARKFGRSLGTVTNIVRRKTHKKKP
jgi:hypothetical protein